jgi:glycosyltransferase involved in cell wall biosynthesis
MGHGHQGTMEKARRISVAVLIDHRPNHPGEVGGLAGTWERVAEVVSSKEELELTLFFLGDEPRCESLGPNVRRVLMRPAVGTERIPFLRSVPTHTDLSPFHPILFPKLKGFDLIHTTDAFHAFAKTALVASRLWNIPLVNSIQTDIIGWARIYTPRILSLILPRQAVGILLDKFRYLDRQERSMERKLGRYARHCAAVMVSHRREVERLARVAPSVPVYFMRRGMDFTRFHPGRRDREKLLARFGIPRERFLLLFVGRLDPVKGVMVAAEVTRGLLYRKREVHLLVVGDGSQREEVARYLGERATITGNLPHDELGWVYASADLLLFPSEAEVWPNVVAEARASSLPVVACRKGAYHMMLGGGEDGLLLQGRDPKEWIEAVDSLLDDPRALREMGERAREDALSRYPSWEEVIEKDIFPVWKGAIEGSLPAAFVPRVQS